ncbi:MATE family efflux transporter [Niabella ginsenosidivorans]|uniref:Multidrug-efflux transporter n=1 Tax=Niabella ginsenosidivorans TaxID=1176587 RepID=A0A1A9IB37_9BACT|nr:MATE family efflux transporter [Niabella ginsenosidivorans]ANH83942.1 MATE family efflux transporter [Niabella ginsenosidivorans]
MNYKTEAGRTLRLAFPIILGELAQISLHLVDTAMIGALGYRELAAAALVLNVINIPFVLGIGITISVAQMVSLAHGRFDRQLISHYLYNGFILCTLTAVLISGALIGGTHILYHLDQKDPQVVAYAIPLMRVMGLSIIPMILFMTLKQFADGLQYTKTAMVLSVSAVPLNALLNWIFIYGHFGIPEFGLIGAGYATLITRTLIFIVLAIVILRHRIFRPYIRVAKNQWKLRWSTIRQLLKIGIPSSLQIGMEAGAFAVSGILMGTIDATTQAAHQIALSCASFTFMVSMGLSQAGSIRVSTAFGARDLKRISVIGKSTIVLALIYGSFCCLLFILLRKQLPLLFNNNTEVLSIAATLLFMAAIFQISDSIQAISAGLLRGIKDVNVPTLFIAIAYWALGIPIGSLLAFRFHMGGVGIWLGLIAGLSFSALFLTIRFLRKASSSCY